MGRPLWRAAVVATALGAGLLAPQAAGADEPTPPLTVNVSGTDGHGRIEAPGLACEDNGDGAYWHYAYTSTLPGGPGHGFSKQPGTVRLNVDLHSDEVRYPNTDARPVDANPNAFLLGDESTASLMNDRGTVRLRLETGGGCGDPTMNFDGITASTAGGNNTWEMDTGTGAYEGATGSGSFALTAAVAPGADNPFSLQLNGTINVRQPALDVQVLKTFWGNLGVDYLLRNVSVTYRITNVGTGNAYEASLASTVPLTGGVNALGPTPQPLGDLLPGEYEDVTVRYFLHPHLLPPPCLLIILGCNFSARINVEWRDALDVLRTPNQVRGSAAPLLPPPL
jgi:hypothetical protein